MKAAYLLSVDGTVEVAVGEVPNPDPMDEELLIRVNAAGVTPGELLWYPTTHTREGAARDHAIPGHEFSGVVTKIGSKVRGFDVGDEVYGMNDWFGQGATAEYCLAVPAGVAPKPAKLSHTDAAAVPIAALTAWQGLFVRAKLQAGDRLLVHGGSGSVGAFVIQLAKMHGAEVIATCSHGNVDFLRSLKVDEVIDYDAVRFENVISNIDVVFDTAGRDSLERSWPLLNNSGRAVTIATDSATTQDPRVRAAFFIVEQNQQQLDDLRPLLDAGYLRPFIGVTIPLSRAPEAYAAAVKSPGGHGKAVVLTEETNTLQ